MVGFFEVVTVAFVAQVAALPGEKVQLIIAALATRYDPLPVVAAAGAAFAGWTALEIAVGAALQALLPGIVLEGLTAGMFLLFAVLLVRSAPGDGAIEPGDPAANGGATDTRWADLDVSIRDRKISTRFGPFLPIFVLMAVGEFGDKTQIVTFGLAAQYGAHPGIWFGEMLAIVPISLANAYVFDRYAGRVDVRNAHLVAAGIFLFFAADTVLAMVVGTSVWELTVEAIADTARSTAARTVP